MKPTKEQIKQHSTQALERALQLFSKLEEKDWGKKASDAWMAKDYLAHLVITQEEDANRLIKQALAGEQGQIPGLESREAIGEYNERMLTTVRDLPVSELTQRFKAAFGEMLSTLEGLSEPDLDRPATSPRWDRPGTVRDLFFAAYLHLPSHYQDIRRAAKKKLPHWIEASAPEEVQFQMDRLFHYMPLIFQSARNRDVQATYLFTMEGTGQWALRVGDGAAETLDGVPDDFDTEVRTKPELWIDLTNNDLNPMWAITTRKVHLGGNASLAMKLGSLFSSSE